MSKFSYFISSKKVGIKYIRKLFHAKSLYIIVRNAKYQRITKGGMLEREINGKNEEKVKKINLRTKTNTTNPLSLETYLSSYSTESLATYKKICKTG